MIGSVIELVDKVAPSIIVAFVFLAVFYQVWKTFTEVYDRRIRAQEENEARLIEIRLGLFPGLMSDLQPLSFSENRLKKDPIVVLPADQSGNSEILLQP